MRQLGVGYRPALHEWILDSADLVRSLEVTAEHFFDGHDETLRELTQQFPIFVHGLGLSLGTPGPLCEQTLEKFTHVAKTADADWVSEHVAFTRSHEVDLGHLNPVQRDESSLSVLVDHAVEVAQRCEKPIILENITTSLELAGDFSETEYLNRLCDRAGCGLLLDVTNLFINAKNHGYDPIAWLHEVDRKSIRQLHVVGYSIRNGRYHDHHSARIQDDLLELVAEVIQYSGVEAVTLERDLRLDALDEIEADLKALENLRG